MGACTYWHGAINGGGYIEVIVVIRNIREPATAWLFAEVDE